MSYIPTTRLERKEPFEVPDDESADLTVYNEVEVIGRSPVQRGARSGEWSEQGGDLYSIKPLSGFGEVVDVGEKRLEKEYSVTYIPERTDQTIEVHRIHDAGPTPEQVFAEQSGPKSPERVATPLAPQPSDA